MVRIVLRVVVLDEERRTLDAIVVALAAIQSAGPGEMNFLLPGVGDLLEVGLRNLTARAFDMGFYKAPHELPLVLVEVRPTDSRRLERRNFALVTGNDVVRRLLTQNG